MHSLNNKIQGELYIVATPIGNLEDISERAKRILAEVDILLCEDTRHTGLLLKRIKIGKKPKLISYYDANEQQRIPEIINQLKAGLKIALVTDAGTPLISDPGYKLVRECIKRDVRLVAIPGPTALITALTVSGLPTNNFYFLGYLPEKQLKRLAILKQVWQFSRLLQHKPTFIIYESPYRLRDLLIDLKNIFGDVEVVVCRELTKVHEEVFRGRISQSISYFLKPKGEFVILFN